MTIALETLRDELREHLGVDDVELDNDAADLLLNRAYWELLDKFPFREKEVSATFATVDGTILYSMPSPFEALRQLSIENPDTFEHTYLRKWSIREYEENYNSHEDARGYPTNYVREGCAVRLWPTPDDAYTITIKYLTVLADLSDDNDSPGIPQQWHEIILYGALWRGYVRFGDYVRSKATQGMWANMIAGIKPTEAKEEVDTHYSGLQAILPEYEL